MGDVNEGLGRVLISVISRLAMSVVSSISGQGTCLGDKQSY